MFNKLLIFTWVTFNQMSTIEMQGQWTLFGNGIVGNQRLGFLRKGNCHEQG